MQRSIFIFLLLAWLTVPVSAQLTSNYQPEVQVAYFGETFFRPGAKIGINLPFEEWRKEKPQETRRRGQYAIIKEFQSRIGANVGFYHQVRNHNGYFFNTELTLRRSKFYSFRPEKKGILDFTIGLGYFRYQLLGTTFTPDGDSFREINGNGGAYLPSIGFAWGGTLKWQGGHNARYYVKSNVMAEVPFGTALQFILSAELGVAVPVQLQFFNPKKKS